MSALTPIRDSGGHGQDHPQPCVLGQDRRHVAGRLAGAGRFPDRLSGLLVERGHGGRPAGRADHAVAVDQERLGAAEAISLALKFRARFTPQIFRPVLASRQTTSSWAFSW